MPQLTTTEPISNLVGLDFEGRYRIEEQLGSGGVGVVYRAVDLRLSRPVALKVLREHVGTADTLKKRFEREAKALAQLAHPNIIGIIDFGVVAHMPFLVMELLKGSTLAGILDKSGPLEPKRAFGIFRQILHGLSYVHQQGFVHRDLKPSNVFLQPISDMGEHVKLLDFGLAKVLDPELADPEHRLTRSGEIFGTPGYIAPEQFSGVPVDPRADIYAAGVILFEMLAGRKPFLGQSTELLRKQLVDPIPTLRAACPSRSATRELDALLQRTMSRDLAIRYTNITELSEAIDALSQPSVRITAKVKKRAQPIELASTLLAPQAGVIARIKKKLLSVGPGVAQAFRSLVQRIVLAGAMAVAAVSILVILIAAVVIILSKRPDFAEQKAQVNTVLTRRLNTPKNNPKAIRSAADEQNHPIKRADTVPQTSVRVVDQSVGVAPAKKAEDIPPPALTDDKPRRSPSVNPWAKAVPKSLAKARKFINAGEYSTERTDAFLRRYSKAHPGDARGYLLLGGLFLNRKWYNDAAKQYEIAYRIDATSRGDPRMLRDLVKLTTIDSTSRYATELVNKIYGQEALPSVERAISAAKEAPVVLERLTRLRSSLD